MNPARPQLGVSTLTNNTNKIDITKNNTLFTIIMIAKQSRAEQIQAKQSDAEQSKAEASKAELSKAKQRQASPEVAR